MLNFEIKNLESSILIYDCMQANMGQAPDRQAALFAGLPTSVPCTAINKVRPCFFPQKDFLQILDRDIEYRDFIIKYEV